MRSIRIEKITLNIGAGKEQANLERGMKLLKEITGLAPVRTFAKKRLPAWGLRPGLPIGCKITLRKKAAKEALNRLFEAIDRKLSARQFDMEGNIAFGLSEYIDIPGIKYNPEIGIMGLEVCITLERPGFRIKRRKYQKKRIPQKHKVTKQEAMEFISKEFNVRIGGEE